MSDISLRAGSERRDFVLRLSANGLNLELLRNGVLVNSTLPLASVTSYTINGGDGNESLTIIQPSDGLLALPGGIFFNGGAQSGPPGDAIAIQGGAAGATVTYTNATDGSIVLTSGAVTATYTFTGVDPIDTSGSTIMTSCSTCLVTPSPR